MRTKIVASVGPSSNSIEILREFYRLGVRCYRINMAHGNPQYWSEIVKLLRELEDVSGDLLCIIGDLPGPSIRLGDFGELAFKKGSKIVFSNSGDGIPIRDREFYEIVEEGDVILLDDGRVMLEIVSSSWDRVEAIAITDGTLRSGKGLTIKGKDMSSQIVRDRDLEAIRFAVENRFTYIGVSHVRTADDLRVIRKTIKSLGGRQRLLAKIENMNAVKNIEAIAVEADGVVIARGDLGMNAGLEEVPSIQRRILKICNKMGKPSIVATQILESMTHSPVPTRAEVSDLYTAIAQGAGAIMLTGETAVGVYPVEAVRWARKIIERAERDPDIVGDREQTFPGTIFGDGNRYSYGIYRLSESLGAPIVVADRDTELASLISVYKPSSRVFLITGDGDAYRQAHILWGVEPIYIEDPNTIARDLGEPLRDIIRRSGLEGSGSRWLVLVNNIEDRKRIDIVEQQ